MMIELAQTAGIIVFLVIIAIMAVRGSTHSWEKRRGKGKEYGWNPKEY